MSKRVIDNPEEYETWESTIPGTIVVKRLDRMGNLMDEIINNGKTLHITPSERRLNHEMAADDDLDVFKNGFLVPVRLVESAEDVEDLRNNPNHMTESDMKEVFATKAISDFRERMEGVTNPITLTRMIELAESEEVNASVRQLDFLKAQLDANADGPAVHEVRVVGAPPRSSAI